jgi:hypothetical protein
VREGGRKKVEWSKGEGGGAMHTVFSSCILRERPERETERGRERGRSVKVARIENVGRHE